MLSPLAAAVINLDTQKRILASEIRARSNDNVGSKFIKIMYKKLSQCKHIGHLQSSAESVILKTQ